MFAELDIQFDFLQLAPLFLRSGHYEQPIIANGLTTAGITTIPLMCRNKWSSQSLYHLIFPKVLPFISIHLLDYNSLNFET